MSHSHIEYLLDLGACAGPGGAIEYAAQFPTLQAAWAACERGDWMLWYAQRTMDIHDEGQLRRLTLAKARCAQLALQLMPDERSRQAVAVAKRYGTGQATALELATAAAAAAYAANAYAAVGLTTAILRQCATIVRTLYPVAPLRRQKQKAR